MWYVFSKYACLLLQSEPSYYSFNPRFASEISYPYVSYSCARILKWDERPVSRHYKSRQNLSLFWNNIYWRYILHYIILIIGSTSIGKTRKMCFSSTFTSYITRVFPTLNYVNISQQLNSPAVRCQREMDSLISEMLFIYEYKSKLNTAFAPKCLFKLGSYHYCAVNMNKHPTMGKGE